MLTILSLVSDWFGGSPPASFSLAIKHSIFRCESADSYSSSSSLGSRQLSVWGYHHTTGVPRSHLYHWGCKIQGIWNIVSQGNTVLFMLYTCCFDSIFLLQGILLLYCQLFKYYCNVGDVIFIWEEMLELYVRNTLVEILNIAI